MEPKIFYLYKITNLVNEKIYIGVHSSTNLEEDTYMGSGTWLKRAIKKYGVQNFSKEILEFFSSEKDMYAREEEIVNEEFIQRNDTYNLTLGGVICDESSRLRGSRKGSRIGGFSSLAEEKGIHDPDFIIRHNEKLKKLGRGVYDPAVRRKAVEMACSEEAIKKRKETMLRNSHQIGEKNSNYGTRWITDGQGNNRKIKKTDTVPDGWFPGRKI